MERTLVLLRHAKAAQPSGIPDADRPLSDRGRVDSAAAGAWLALRGLRPTRVLCSPARRARETWQAVAAALGDGSTPEVAYQPEIYQAYAGELLELVQATSVEVDVLLLVGHNPGVSALSKLLDPDGFTGEGLHTAGIAVHRVGGAWTTLETAPRIEIHTARG
jgi:phosphohistidine phosphatase